MSGRPLFIGGRTPVSPPGPSGVSQNPGSLTCLANQAGNAVVATLNGIGGTPPYTSFGVTGNANLTISGANLKTVASPTFVPGVNETYKLSVTDSNAQTYTDPTPRTLTVPAGPTAVGLSGTTVAAGAPAGTIVGALSTTGGTPPDTYVNTNTKFAVSGSNLVRSSTGTLNAGTPESVNITATDQAALSTNTATNGQGPFSISVVSALNVTTFSVTNFSGSSSRPFLRFGLPFKKGDIPSGSVPQIIDGSSNVMAVQFDQITTWSDGSMKFCVCQMRDDASGDFTGSETRNYTVQSISASLPPDTHPKTLSDIAANTQLQVQFTNVNSTSSRISVSDYQITDAGAGLSGTITATIADATINGQKGPGTGASAVCTISGGVLTALTITQGTGHFYNQPVISFSGTHTRLPTVTLNLEKTAYGPGSFTADFNTLAAVATRVTQVHKGPVCDGFEVWGMASHSGTDDVHLKTNWHVDIWKNSDGTIAGYEYGAVVAQDWWGASSGTYSAPKFRLLYNASLYNLTASGSPVETYSSGLTGGLISHVYQSQWITCHQFTSGTDYNEGRRPWTSAIPTLFYKPNQPYWISTGLVPPFDLSLATGGANTVNSNATLGYDSHYSPASSQDHRANIDQTGGYMGRGLIPTADAVAFLRQTADDYRWARNNHWAGLHIPYHWRSNDQRTRPGDGSADVANTIMSNSLYGHPIGGANINYDFTSVGMPAPVDAYAGFGTAAGLTHGYVVPSGCSVQGGSGGIAGIWSLPTPAQSSHNPNFAYFMYLHEGERPSLECAMDLAANLINQQLGGTAGSTPNTVYSTPAYSSLVSGNPPSQQITWGAMGSMPVFGNCRAIGWNMIIMGSGTTVCPDSDPQKNYLVAANAQQLAWLAEAKNNSSGNPYPPQSMFDLGILSYNTQDFDYPGYMHDFICMGALFNYQQNEKADALTIGTWIANRAINLVNSGIYLGAFEQFKARPIDDLYNSSTNPFWAPSNATFPPGYMVGNRFRCSVVAATDILTAYDVYANNGNMPNLLANGDTLYANIYSVTNQTGASFSGYISGTTLNITSTISGQVCIGQTLNGPGIAAGTYITAGSSKTWTVNNSQTVGSVGSPVAMTTPGIPVELTQGVPYYVINLSPASLNPTFQLTSVQGDAGHIVNFTRDYPQMPGSTGGIYFGWFASAAGSYPTLTTSVYLPGADSDIGIMGAVIPLAYRNGIAGATLAVYNKSKTFFAPQITSGPQPATSWPNWTFAA